MPTPPDGDKAAETARLEAALRERDVWLTAQREAFQAAMDGASLETSLGILIDAVVKQAGDDRRCAFYIADAEGTKLSHVVGMPDSYSKAVEGFVISPESLAYGLAVATGEPVVTPDVLEEPRWQPWTWFAAEHDYRACWSFPVEASAGKQVGLFVFYFREPRDATAYDREVAAAVTQAAAIIIARHKDGEPLGDSGETYRALFASMDESFLLVEVLRDKAGQATDIRYLDENAASKRRIGMSVRGQTLREIDPSFDREWLEILDRVDRTAKSERFERFSPVAAEWHDYHVFAVTDGPSRVGVLSSDVTERKRAQETLRESEERLRMALEAGRMGTYRFDVHTGIEQWSDSEYELLGLERTNEPPTRELFLSLVHPDDLHLVQYTANDRRPPGTSLDSEFRIIRADTGEVRYLTAHALARFGSNGKPTELIGVNQDVTEERRARAAQRATEERLQQFSRASSDVLWIRDVKTLQWEYLSPAFDHIYGLTRQDALRDDNFRSWLSFIVPEDRDGARAALGRVANGERVAFEYRIRRPDGDVRWLRNTDFPIHDQKGTVTHVAGVGSDITAMKRAEEHQRFLLAELQHRVRNTLAVIRSITRRTAATTDSKEEFFTHLDGRIAAFARVQGALTRDPTRGVDLAMLLAEELRVIGGQEGRGLTIEGPPVALAPKAAETLGLAIHELATNAIKHGSLASSGGAIDIVWEIVEADGKQLQLSWTEHGANKTVEQPRRKGFGAEILERTLAYELKATTQMDFRPSGLICSISIPLGQMANAS